MPENTVQVRVSRPWKSRLLQIAIRAGVPERFVLDRLIEHYGEAVERMLTEPVRVDPRSAEAGR